MSPYFDSKLIRQYYPVGKYWRKRLLRRHITLVLLEEY